jgi:hypothetical protein
MNTDHNNVKFLFIIISTILLFSCAHVRPAVDEKCSLAFGPNDNFAPKKVAVLPFVNSTDNEALGGMLRESFYDHFSSKNYHDFELHEVDSYINQLEKAHAKKWRHISPAEIRRFFSADYLIYGEVQDLEKTFWLFYSKISLSVNIKIYETGSNSVVWEKTIVQCSSSGDIPLGPLDIFTIIARARSNINEESMLNLVDKTCRQFADKIPEPPVSQSVLRLVDIHLGSFTEENRAVKIQKELRHKGFEPRITQVHIKNKLYHRVIIGPYQFAEAERIKDLFSADPRFSPKCIRHT